MINIEMKVARIMLLACIITSVSCREQPIRRQQSDTNQAIAVTADALTIEMFKPYLTKQHNINDVMRAFPEPYFFNAGGAIRWATYKLSDGTILRVGEHGEASAILKNAEGAVIQRFPFGSWVETRFPVIGSAGSPVDISPARLQRAKYPPGLTSASLFENWDGTLITRQGTARTDLRPKAGVLFRRYPYMTVGGHFRPTGTFVCYVPDKGAFFLLGDCVMNHAELLWGPYAGDPRKVLLDVMRDSKQDAPSDADKALKQIRAGKPKAIPFQPIPAKSIAYVGGLRVTVYLVADDAVLRLVIPLGKTRIKGNSVVSIASSKSQASLFRGKDARRYVLPRGAAPPLAPSIKRESAVSGKFICIDIPAQKTWPYHGKTKITVKDMQLMFPSGRVTAEGPLTFVLRPFPPGAALPANGAAAGAATKAAEPLDLDKTAKMLTKATGGTWRTKTKALYGTIPMNGVFDTLCVVFPFPYDEAGKAKVLSYMEPRARGFRVLGSTEQCTVLADLHLPDPPEKAAAFFAAVSKALKLRPVAQSLDLNKTAKMLTKAAGGNWRTKTDNMGVTLEGTVPWGGRFHTLCVVFPFRYDKIGKAKVLSYADCARSFRVLGSTEQCTVLTDQYGPNPPAKAAAFAAAVSKALKLRPAKLTLEALRRSRQLKANVNSFALQVWCHGPKDKSYYRLLLTAVPIERKERPFEMIRLLNARQVEKIIDHLAAEGFLTRAVKMDKKTKKVYEGPAYFMTIPMGISRLEGTLGWGPGMLKRLDALREVLDGNAASAMDSLLMLLTKQHPKWKKPRGTLPMDPQLLGKILSVREVVRRGYTFIAICEALNEPQAVSDATGAYQKFKVHAFLDGTGPAGKVFNLNYHYYAHASPPERPVRKGEKVIWIVGERTAPYKGVKVLAYTRENRNAVDEAVMFERYAGKAVNGLKLTLRAAKAATAMRLDGRGAKPVQLAFTFANVGDKPIKLETSDHMWPRLCLHVTGPSGKSVRITERMAERIGPIKVAFSVLKAGQSVTYSRLSGEYFGGKHESRDLLKPGAYRIWASYLSAVAVSNEITLTVKAAPATRPAEVVRRAPGAGAKVMRRFEKIDAFVRGDARIALGRTRAEIREQLSKGKVKSHKPYAFRKPQPEMFERNVWVIFYGPEVPGMGRVDVLRISFKDGKVSKLEQKMYLCP